MELCKCRVPVELQQYLDMWVAHSHPVIPATGLCSNMYALEKSIVIEVSYNIRDKLFVDSAWILFWPIVWSDKIDTTYILVKITRLCMIGVGM